MFFYILIIPVLILSVYMILSLRKARKHDLVLYRFCQIRRDTIELLRQEGLQLSREEYFANRRLLEFLNVTIHYYDELKTSLFNFRKFARYLKDFRNQAIELERFDLPNEPKIKHLYQRFGFTMLFAFFTYTPLIRSEMILKLIMVLFVALRKITGNSFYSPIKFIELVKNLSQKFDIPLRLTKPIPAFTK